MAVHLGPTQDVADHGYAGDHVALLGGVSTYQRDLKLPRRAPQSRQESIKPPAGARPWQS
jgi:hypothetical protein